MAHPDHQGPSFASSFILDLIRCANAGVRRLTIWMKDVTNPRIEMNSVHDRKRRKSCTVRDAELVIDVTEVNLHGSLGEIKPAGYHLVRVSLAQRDDNLPLAWR